MVNLNYNCFLLYQRQTLRITNMNNEIVSPFHVRVISKNKSVKYSHEPLTGCFLLYDEDKPFKNVKQFCATSALVIEVSEIYNQVKGWLGKG